MSHHALDGNGSQDEREHSELRRFAVVVAAKPAPISGLRVAGLEADDGEAQAVPTWSLRRFAICPR
jgi:hypothetical protein